MKRAISLLLSVAMLLSLVVMANAAGGFAGAHSYKIGATETRYVYGDDEVNTYKFTLAEAGKINLSLYADIPYMYVTLYEPDGDKVWYNSVYDNDTTKEIRSNYDMYLCAGTYYLSLDTNDYEGSIQFKITETPAYETFREAQGGSNNSTKNASFITYGNKYVGCIARNDETDVYKFTLYEAGKMSLDLYGDMSYVRAELFDENGTRLWSNGIYDNDTTKEIKYQTDFHLRQGTYYFSYSSSNHGAYNFKFNFTSANESIAETLAVNNDQTSSANIIKINQKYTGQLALGDNTDVYAIYVDKTSPKLGLYAQVPHLKVEIYDKNGSRVWYENIYDNDTTKTINTIKSLSKVKTGTYYVAISGDKGPYTFYITNGGTVKTTPYTNRTITVKVDGKYVPFTQPPRIEFGTTLVPLRAIFEALDATVEWDGATQKITSTKNGVKIVMQIGSTKMYINGVEKTLNIPAKIINSTTLVPVRAVSEAFKCNVTWDSNTQTVVVTSK